MNGPFHIKNFDADEIIKTSADEELKNQFNLRCSYCKSHLRAEVKKSSDRPLTAKMIKPSL